MEELVVKFNSVWDYIHDNGKLSSVAQTIWGADMWMLNGWSAHLTDGGYGRAIIGPSFRAYNVYNIDGEQIVLSEGDETLLTLWLTNR